MLRDMTRDETLVRSQAVVARVVAVETLIVPIRAKVGDLASIYSFNRTGSRFIAPGVPALGPAESEVAPRKWDKPAPPGLPGNGMAQHPIIYVGEGYNKILLVDNGKIAW